MQTSHRFALDRQAACQYLLTRKQETEDLVQRLDSLPYVTVGRTGIERSVILAGSNGDLIFCQDSICALAVILARWH